MDSSLQEREELNLEAYSTLGVRGKTIRAHFSSVRRRLESTLEPCRSLAALLQGDYSLARHFGLTLAGDDMAGKIDSLFGKIEFAKDDEGKLDDTICWLDIVLAPTYRPTHRKDGYYYLQLNGRKGWIKITESNHNILKSGLPQKLVDPRSYPNDTLLEKETMELVEGLLSTLNEHLSQIIDTNNDSRARISKRLGALEKFSRNIQEPGPIEDHLDNADLKITGSPKPATTRRVGKRKWPSAWEQEELDLLPQWYQDHRHLTKKQIETDFKTDFHKARSYSAIVSAKYRARKVSGGGRVGTERELHQNDPTLPLTGLKSTGAVIPAGLDTSPRDIDSALGSIPFLTRKSFLAGKIKAITPLGANAGSRPNENQFSSAARVGIESPYQAGNIIPAAEETTLNGGSSGGGHRPVKGFAVDAQGGASVNANDPDEMDNLASFPLGNSQQGFNSGVATAPPIAIEKSGAQSGTIDCLPNHADTAGVDCMYPGIATGNPASSMSTARAQSRRRGNQLRLCETPDYTSSLPIHQEQLSPSNHSTDNPSPARWSRKSSAPARGKKAGYDTDRRRRKRCDGQRPSYNNCAESQIICGGYGSQTSSGTKTLHHDSHNVVDWGISSTQLGQQCNMSATADCKSGANVYTLQLFPKP